MAKLRRKQNKGENQTAQTLKQRLIFLISFLSVGSTVLILRVGEALWPAWMVDYRSRIIGILLLALVLVILLSPLIIESSRRPRDFPGPGKNPYIDP
jgi:hypothetical protein